MYLCRNVFKQGRPRKMKKLFLLIIIPLIAVSKVGAQSLWSIEQCITHAIDNNIQIKQATTDIEVSRLSNQQSKLAYIPSLSASVSQSTNWGRSLDPTTYNFINNQTVNNVNGGLSLGTTLFAGMQKLHTLKKSELNLISSIQSSQQIKNEITIAVAAAYLQVLYNKEQIRNSQSQIASVEQQVERTKMLVDAGSQPLGALLELQSQLAGENYTLVSTQNTFANSLLNLKQLLEIREQPEFDIVEPVIDTLTPGMIADMENTYQQALSLPQIELAKLKNDIAKHDVSLAKARMYPTLNFGLSYGSSWSDARQKPQLGTDGMPYYTAYPFFEQFKDNASTAMQFSLSIPIFNSLSAQHGIRIAKWQKSRTELGLTLAENQLYKEIQQAYTDAVGALEKYRSAQSSLTSANEAFTYAQQKFSAGATTSVDYTTAKNNQIIAQSMVVQAKYEYIFKVKILDFYGGQPITL